MGARRRAREFALQALYLADISKSEPEKSLRNLMAGSKLDDKTTAFAQRLTTETIAHRDELDVKIKQIAENWEINRMAAIDRNILRMGIYEILYEKETPVSVIIDEAVEMAKMFSTKDSSKFVNGILDKIKPDRDSDPSD